jgi:cbb3-type cytochrome oxidase subunit 3
MVEPGYTAGIIALGIALIGFAFFKLRERQCKQREHARAVEAKTHK